MSNSSTPQAVRKGPVGRWSNIEICPYGEAIEFYPKGTGIHYAYCGLACQETYFEWQPVSEHLIRVRWLDDPYGPPDDEETELPEPAADEAEEDGWELVTFSVVEDTHPYGGQWLRLNAMFCPLLAREELWYNGTLPERPTSDWSPPVPQANAEPHAQTPWYTSGEFVGVVIGMIWAACFLTAAAFSSR